MNRSATIALVLASVAAIGAGAYAYLRPRIVPMPAAEAAARDAWDFRLTAIDGAPLPMARFQGEVVLLVNTASFCGFTPQYDGLEAVQKRFAGRGFTVIGVPSGNFLDQEYKDNAAIATSCKTKFGITFPLAERSDVVGANAIPLYRWAAARLGPENAPKWNFHKYLIGRDGRPIAAFGSKVAPQDAAITDAIEAALAAPAV